MARKAKHTSAETRESIIESFIDIYEEKGIDKTTVSAIVNRAHITRSTFYCYFRDVNELLEIAEREFFDNYIKVILPMVIRAVVAGDTTAIVPEISGLFKDHRRYVLLFLVTRPSPELTAQVKAFGRSCILSYFDVDEATLSERKSAAIEYIISAQLGLVTWWLADGCAITVPEMLKLITDLNSIGPVTVLSEIH